LLKKAGYKIRAETMGLGNSLNCQQEPVLPYCSTRKMLGKRDTDTLINIQGF
jgi:hypothetical protein